jgi:hypothetical protein
MKRYIRSSDDDEFMDYGSEYAFADAPHIFGYKFFSTMTGITIMFCHEDEDYLSKHISEIYKLMMETEDADGEYQEYCDENGIAIVDDEYGDLVQDDDFYIAEIDGEQYIVDVIASDKGRF